MEHEDPYHRQALWPPRSKVNATRSRGPSDSCWPISRERNALKTPKLVGRLPTSWAIMHTSFKVKGQRSRSLGRLMLRAKVYHIFRTERPTNFKIGIPMEHRLSTATASYKGLWSLVLARWWGHTVSSAPGGHTTCLQCHYMNTFIDRKGSMIAWTRASEYLG